MTRTSPPPFRLRCVERARVFDCQDVRVFLTTPVHELFPTVSGKLFVPLGVNRVALQDGPIKLGHPAVILTAMKLRHVRAG